MHLKLTARFFFFQLAAFTDYRNAPIVPKGTWDEVQVKLGQKKPRVKKVLTWEDITEPVEVDDQLPEELDGFTRINLR